MESQGPCGLLFYSYPIILSSELHNLNSFALIGPFKMPTNWAYLAKEVIIIAKILLSEH